MKILNVCSDDYANFAFDNLKALQSIGVDAIGLKRIKHPFGYTTELPIVHDTIIQEMIKSSDLVQVFHSDVWLAKQCEDFNIPYVVYHTGTAYRNNVESFNEVFKNAKLVLTDQCEFVKLAPMVYIATAIDTDNIKPISKSKLIGHYPSNPMTKGTNEIINMLNECQVLYNYSTDIIPHKESLLRMGSSAIYVELFKPLLNGKEYGCFGVTAFEAAAMGCVVVTQNTNHNIYSDVYGGCPFHLANTEDQFKQIIYTLTDPDININLLGDLSKAWIEDKHSYKSTGTRLINILNKI